MKKLIFLLCFLPVLSFGQNRFPSIDSAKNYVLRYVKNSAVESFTNLRMQNVAYGTLQLIDSLCSAGVIDTIWKSGDTLKYRVGGTTVTVGVFGSGSTIDTTSLSNRINLKVNISDTSAMLTNYRHWLAGYLTSSSITGKLNISDTANMLLPYLRSNVAAATYQPLGNYITTGSDASLRNLTITGTNGNGHIHLRHQASLPTATGQSTVIYANSDGNFAYKNDGNYHTTFSTHLNTADRVYKFQNKSYTIADSADVETRLKITDAAATYQPIGSYLTGTDTTSLSNRINNRLLITDTAAMLNGRISSITLNTSGSIHSTPINFTRLGGAWSGTMSLATQSANRVFAGPTTGSAATPTFRALVDADIPSTSKGVQWTGVDSSMAQNTARKGYHEFADFGFANAVGMLTGSSYFYSPGANVTSIGVQEAGVNGLVRLSTSTAITGFGAVYHFTPFLSLSSNDWMVVEYRIKIPILNDGTEKFWIQIGLFDVPTILNIANGVAFYYMLDGDAATSASSANWQCVSANSSNRTFTTTSAAVAADTWVKLTIKIKSNVAAFFVNDTQVATHTNNLPSTSTFLTPQFHIRKTAGSTSRSLLVDYFTCDIKYSTEK